MLKAHKNNFPLLINSVYIFRQNNFPRHVFIDNPFIQNMRKTHEKYEHRHYIDSRFIYKALAQKELYYYTAHTQPIVTLRKMLFACL